MDNIVLGKVSFVPKGEWNSSTVYFYLDVVTYAGNGYIAKKDSLGVAPIDGASNDEWMMVVRKGKESEPGNTVPLAAVGTGSIGTSMQYSREDHAHPLQENITGNAGTADKLKTPHKIGEATFDGSSDISLSDMGAATADDLENLTGRVYSPGGEVDKLSKEMLTAANVNKIFKVKNTFLITEDFMEFNPSNSISDGQQFTDYFGIDTDTSNKKTIRFYVNGENVTIDFDFAGDHEDYTIAQVVELLNQDSHFNGSIEFNKISGTLILINPSKPYDYQVLMYAKDTDTEGAKEVMVTIPNNHIPCWPAGTNVAIVKVGDTYKFNPMAGAIDLLFHDQLINSLQFQVDDLKGLADATADTVGQLLNDIATKQDQLFGNTSQVIGITSDGRADSMNFGGRNYIVDSHIEMEFTSGSKSLTFGMCGSKEIAKSLYGKEITVSFDYECALEDDDEVQLMSTNTDQTITKFTSESNGTGHRARSIKLKALIDGQVEELAAVVEEEEEVDTDHFALNILSFMSTADTVKGTIKIHHLKLELGGIATDWTPALEDMNRVDYSYSASCDDMGNNIFMTYARIPEARKVVLGRDDWDDESQSQEVTCKGIYEDETKQLISWMPKSIDKDKSDNAGIQCIAQGEDKLTFSYATKPEEDITLFVSFQVVHFVDDDEEDTPED